ncbi:MAG: hypothetical protein ACXAC8_14300 [Candidatus Hodarchaeales archaeon]|jgi:hypothetical protein
MQLKFIVAGYLTRIVAYQVTDDGFFDPVVFKKENLVSDEVFIFVNDEEKELWIWIGSNADVRTRFISSTVAQEIRRLYGLTLRVRSADHLNEPSEFWDFLDSVPQEGLGPQQGTTSIVSNFSNTTSIQAVKSKSKPIKKRATKKKTKAAVKTKTKTPRKSIRKKSTKKTKKKSLESSKMIVKPLSDYLENQLSSMVIPPCPKCEKGHFLPYSQEISSSSQEKHILTFALWICSNCGFTPSNNPN